jgi:hypothetical protein
VASAGLLSSTAHVNETALGSPSLKLIRAVVLRVGLGTTAVTVGLWGGVVSTSQEYVTVVARGFFEPTLGITPLTLKVLLPSRAVTDAVPVVPEPQAVALAPFSEHVKVSDVGAVQANDAAVELVVAAGV